MSEQIEYNHRYSPDPEILRLLELSRAEVEDMSPRDLRCPICGFRIQSVYADRSGHINVKCQKCKFIGTLNLAYFRRQKKHSNCFIMRPQYKQTR